MKRIVITILLLYLVGCITVPTPNERLNTADQLTEAHGWQRQDIETSHFTLRTYLSSNINNQNNLTIYIEGDGLAWITPSRPSLDPTPIDPLALKLALNKSKGNAVYLARPCQYNKDENPQCTNRYWTSARFSPEVIDTTNQAIDQLKVMFSASKLTLVGYSGGAAVAALVAARRNDVQRLTTIAGNLDHKAWTDFHRISPLTESMNPADFWQQLQSIEQVHYVGARDTVIPEFVIQSYIKHFPTSSKQAIQVMPEYDHHCCWNELELVR